MKKIEDLVASAKAVHDRYVGGRMDREIVRAWVLGLGEYPSPHGQAVVDAKAWFRQSHSETDAVEHKLADLERLHNLYAPASDSPAPPRRGADSGIE